jgi:heptosyltransferase-2
MEAVAGLAGKDAVVVRPTEDVRVFAAILELMDVIVCGDTLALQLALAMARPAVALFGSTCSSEIDTFGCGVKIVSPLDCGPCYRAECTRKPDCMDAISVDRVVDAVRSLLRRRIGVAG